LTLTTMTTDPRENQPLWLRMQRQTAVADAQGAQQENCASWHSLSESATQGMCRLPDPWAGMGRLSRMRGCRSPVRRCDVFCACRTLVGKPKEALLQWKYPSFAPSTSLQAEGRGRPSISGFSHLLSTPGLVHWKYPPCVRPNLLADRGVFAEGP
jgi:hypothetical protein